MKVYFNAMFNVAKSSGYSIGNDLSEWNFSEGISYITCSKQDIDIATDSELPPLVRLKFLCRSSIHLDNFFEIQVSHLQDSYKANQNNDLRHNPLLFPKLALARSEVVKIIHNQNIVLNDGLLPILEDRGINFLSASQWSEPQKNWLYEYFKNTLLPLISPIAIDIMHPFPRVPNKTLCFLVQLAGKDAFGRNGGKAFIQIPQFLPQLLELPSGLGKIGTTNYVFLSSVIQEFIEDLFNGMHVVEMCQFRVTRGVETRESDKVKNGNHEKLSVSRGDGAIVRLELEKSCSSKLHKYLSDTLELPTEYIYFSNAMIDYSRYMMACNTENKKLSTSIKSKLLSGFTYNSLLLNWNRVTRYLKTCLFKYFTK